MIQILLPVVIAALAGTAYVVATKPKPGAMTPERQVILDTALNSTSDPDKLRALAKVFREEGLPAQADLLEKRAKLRELPSDVKEARKAAFRAGMASKNPVAVRALADEFEREGATGAAAALRTYAFTLDNPKAAGLGLPSTVDGHGTGVIPDAPGTVDGHGTGLLPENPVASVMEAIKLVDSPNAAMQAAADLVKQQSPTSSPEENAATLLAMSLAGLPPSNTDGSE